MGKKITTAAKGAVPNVRLTKAPFVQLPKICIYLLNIEVNRAYAIGMRLISKAGPNFEQKEPSAFHRCMSSFELGS